MPYSDWIRESRFCNREQSASDGAKMDGLQEADARDFAPAGAALRRWRAPGHGFRHRPAAGAVLFGFLLFEFFALQLVNA